MVQDLSTLGIITLIVAVVGLTSYSFYKLGTYSRHGTAKEGFTRRGGGSTPGAREAPSELEDYPSSQAPGLRLMSQGEYLEKVDTATGPYCPLCGAGLAQTTSPTFEGDTLAIANCHCARCGFDWWEVWRCVGLTTDRGFDTISYRRWP